MCQANNRNFVFAPRAKESFHQMQNNPNPQLMSAYLTDTIYKFDKCKGTKKEYPQNQRPAMWKNNNNAIQREENQRYEFHSSKPEKKIHLNSPQQTTIQISNKAK